MTQMIVSQKLRAIGSSVHTATHCNALQDSATHYSTLQHTKYLHDVTNLKGCQLACEFECIATQQNAIESEVQKFEF